MGVRGSGRHDDAVLDGADHHHRSGEPFGNQTYGGSPRGQYREKSVEVGAFGPNTLACTTCTGMCGNGSRIATRTATRARSWTAMPRLVFRVAHVCCAGAPGTTGPRGPPVGQPSSRTSGHPHQPLRISGWESALIRELSRNPETSEVLKCGGTPAGEVLSDKNKCFRAI